MQHFYRHWETTLYQGHAMRLVTQLNAWADRQPKIASELRREAGYFANNCRRMNYLELRSDGWVIGSGVVESAGKQPKPPGCTRHAMESFRRRKTVSATNRHYEWAF